MAAQNQINKSVLDKWPERHLHTEDLKPVPFHVAQNMLWDSKRRSLVMSAGSQSGKTSWGPWWLAREIYDIRSGPNKDEGGDYLAVTASFDMFKLKMLPTMLSVFIDILGVGRYWTGDRVLELRDPVTNEFKANKATDPMWARIILRSADALGGLESATAKGAWLDECGQDRFTFDAYKAIRRRTALRTGRLLMTTTLYQIGWFTQHIVDPVIADGQTSFVDMNGAEIEATESDKRDALVVQFDSILNPSFPRQEYEEQRALLPDEEFQMLYRGRKASRRFLIYDNFKPELHTVEPFEIPPHWRHYVGLDFGGTHTCAMYYAEDPISGKLYCYREYLAGNRTIQQHVNEILKNEVNVPQCHGGARSEDQWRREYTQAGLQVMPPQTDDVDVGINRVYALHASHAVIYFKTLSGIIDEKNRYRRKRNKEGEILNEIENKNTFHRLDAERYILGTIRPGTSLKMKIINLGEAYA